jgi:pimeloyl-ACP methyl ester carboxylesterase
MQRKELRAVGELLGEATGGTGVFVKQIHEAIAGRTFGALGGLGLPARVLHDRLAAAVYEAVRRTLGALPRGSAAMLERTTPTDAGSLSESARGSIVLGALNGVIGDSLASRDSELALTMSIRSRGEEITADPTTLARALPGATPKLAVFVHGLCETDEAWHFVPPGVGHGRPRRSYGSRLKAELGYTPLYLRYNSGLRISDNGRRLSELLEEVVERWPTPVEEIAVIGHSMGGLVARSACHYGHAVDARWARSLRHVFCLGSPHLGAPLEKAANVTGYALARVPETRPFANLLNGRSVGIKDLRFGSCVEEDWCDCDPDEFLTDRCREVPFLECATYYFIGATLTDDANHPLGSVVGDLLVRFPSASGQGRRRRIPFEIANGRHLGGVNHFQLLNHPDVYEQIRAWLARPSAVAA